MSDWKNVVCAVERLEKHTNSDNLSIATVMGDYPVIVKTGDYQVGDLVSYLSIDGIFPDTEEFHFLTPRKIENYEENGETKSRVIGAKYEVGKCPEKNRIIRAKRIRQVYSQGLLMRVPEGFKEGDDVTEYFGLKKWEEPEEEDNTPTKKSVGKNAEKAPTTFTLPYYDIEGIRKVINHFDENITVAVSEKIHGCFEYDTLIDTLEHGSIKIGDIVENKIDCHVKSLDVNSGNIEYQKCIGYHNNGDSDDWYEIETEDGNKITVTGNHLIWMPKLKCYRRVLDLTENDYILSD